MSGFSADPK